MRNKCHSERSLGAKQQDDVEESTCLKRRFLASDRNDKIGMTKKELAVTVQMNYCSSYNNV